MGESHMMEYVAIPRRILELMMQSFGGTGTDFLSTDEIEEVGVWITKFEERHPMIEEHGYFNDTRVTILQRREFEDGPGVLCLWPNGDRRWHEASEIFDKPLSERRLRRVDDEETT